MVGNEPVISMASSVNPAATGQLVTFTATVIASDGGTPTGVITFTKSNQAGTLTMSSAPIVGGQASITWGFGTPGAKFITATYSGDSNYESSVSPALAQVVH